MSVDLLTVGEALAELDLVVRQLDDGSLTLATDDTLPDEDRVRVSGSPDGLLASLRVGQAQLGPALARALDALNGASPFGRWVCRAGAIRVEAHLPFGDRSFSGTQLQLLYGSLASAAEAEGPKVMAVARGEVDPRALQATLLTPVMPATEKLPPSLLPGAGQKGPDERATRRFGEEDGVKVGVRGALASQGVARASSARQSALPAPMVARKSGGGGGGALIVAGLVVLALGAAAWAGKGWWESRNQPVEPPAPAFPPAQPLVPAPPVEPDPTPGPTGTTPTPPAKTDVPVPPSRIETEAQLLERLEASPGEATKLIARWSEMGWDKKEGARRRLLEALPKDAETPLAPDATRALLKSMRDRPPDPFEAMDCYPLAPESLRRLLLQQLAQAGEGEEEVATFLGERLAEDTPDKLMQEVLLTLGRPRPDTIGSLVAARGAEWALLSGRALIEGAVEKDLKLVEPLLAHEDEEVRGFACGLLGRSKKTRDALGLLAPLLSDQSEKVQGRAVEACVQLGDPDASWPLARALQRAQASGATDSLRDAFRRLAPNKQTVSILVKLQARDSPTDRLAAVLALEATETAEAVPHIIKGLTDKAREVRLASVQALAGFQKSRPALRTAVEKGLGPIRTMALDKSDKELSRLASQLHLAISGRMPDGR